MPGSHRKIISFKNIFCEDPGQTLFKMLTVYESFFVLRGLAFIDVSLRNAINHGDIEGPRLQVATLFIGSTGSHGDDKH